MTTSDDVLTAEELETLPRMRLDLDQFDAFRADDVRALLDIIDRLDRALRAARQQPSVGLDDNGPSFMILSNAGRHDVACRWSRMGIVDAEAEPCTCGLADDLRAVAEYARIAPTPGTDEVRAAVEEVLPRLSHWPEWGHGHGFNPQTEPHSKMCPPCVLRRALGGQ